MRMVAVPVRLSPRKPAHDRLVRGTTEHYQDTALYDFEYRDRVHDILWYRRIAAKHARGGPVLELGAGTGRITVPLLDNDHHVIALDRMRSMLDALCAKLCHEQRERVRAVEADMTALPFGDATIPLVIAPFNVLMHLYSYEHLLACFREVRRVLVPGGTFAFDVQLPDLEWLCWDPDVRHAITPFVHPTTHERLVYSTNHTYDPATQICHVRIYYDVAPPRGRKFIPPKRPKRLVHLAHRQIFPEELRGLLVTAGLRIESVCADFREHPLWAGIEQQVVVCTS